MNTTDDNLKPDEQENLNVPKINLGEPVLPQQKVDKLLEQLEIFSVKGGRRGNNGFDMSKFNENQVDKLLGLLGDNEKNAFDYHSKRLDTAKTIKLKEIDASIVDQKTNRIIMVLAAVLVVVLTLVVLLVKSEFFISWLTFLTGLIGGFGLGKAQAAKKTESDQKSLDSQSSNDE